MHDVPPRSAAAGFVIMETIEQAQWIVNNLNGCSFAKVKIVSGVKLMSLQLLVNRNSRSSGCPTISGVIDHARVESNGIFADHVLVSGMLWLGGSYKRLELWVCFFFSFWQKLVGSLKKNGEKLVVRWIRLATGRVSGYDFWGAPRWVGWLFPQQWMLRKYSRWLQLSHHCCVRVSGCFFSVESSRDA